MTLLPHVHPNIPQKMSDYLPYGKLNEGVKHVDIGVSVAFPETEVKGCSVHLPSHYDIWANTRKQLVDDLGWEAPLTKKINFEVTCSRSGAVQTV